MVKATHGFAVFFANRRLHGVDFRIQRDVSDPGVLQAAAIL